MYTRVVPEQCIACGLCQLKAPELFEYDEEGVAYVKIDNNHGTTPIPAALMAKFKDAYTSCPTGAILRSAHPFTSTATDAPKH
ncbi:ferredoxin [Lapidilactobacillus gannanensis]|jgi:ferredoxin|uniref:Ferredoxin n=1 Tax=Lapidilactobacillus gannanensis TaxID=2486002 RepID=A0ABW4BSF5_9LACO|nr:ferredoxin [Lapidilactobacillus gannanensis]MCH4057394.1 ferredoxin [Lactobacillaceae bacterium]